MKPRRQNLSKLELQVMRPFWKHGELTVRQAAEILTKEPNDPGYSTVQTIVGRLEKKQALKKTSKVGNAWLFKALLERSNVINRMVDELINLLDGAHSPIVSHLLKSETISQSELEEIRKMIAEKAEHHE
ncbi:MAG: BlaI/MecI/CopY family transcriptional regulator [Verrucomicrobiae bacterium]|nr:BlaI/MecI/CopY family transcriptional regulator [Verrucomicrobiae bacterium]